MIEYVDKSLVRAIIDSPRNKTQMLHRLEDAPTITGERVLHGHWESRFENGKVNTYCSVCGGITYGLYHYCPDCGAKMDEGEKL